MGEINIDKDNAVEISDLGIQIEAIEDKIIVLVDTYKSGYECKTCNGTGKVKSTVVEGAEKDCDDCKGKGALLEIPEISKSLPTLGTVFSVGEKTRWAQFLKRKNTPKEFQILHFPDEETEYRLKTEEKEIKIRPGAKVLFQPHVGTMIPFKGNVRFKIMREHEPLAVIYGVDIDARKFMDFDVPFENRY